MYEDIGTLIGKGFDTWKRNLNIAVPFLLYTGIIILLAFVMIILVLFPAVSTFPDLIASPSNIESAEEIMDSMGGAFEDNLGFLVAVVIVFVLLMFLATSYFTAGAIGMAKEATERGKTTLKDMWYAGKRNYVSLFIAWILMVILVFLGFSVLLVPLFLMTAGGSAAGAFTFGTLSWIALLIVYMFLVSLALALVPYALVIDNLGPVDAIKAGFKFFMSNKMDVFLVWLVILAVSIAFGFIGVPLSTSETASAVWSFLSTIISIVVISPLSTVWWTRLYMTRTGWSEKSREPWEDEEVKYL